MAEWREIKGYKYPYRISDQGEVQKLTNKKGWVTLLPRMDNTRAVVQLRTVDGRHVRVGVFRLLDECFCGGHAKKHGLYISPKNGSALDCSVENILYHTKGEISAKTMSRSMRKVVIEYDKNNNTKIYKSITEAAAKNGIPQQTFSWRLRHGVLDPRGYRWEVER